MNFNILCQCNILDSILKYLSFNSVIKLYYLCDDIQIYIERLLKKIIINFKINNNNLLDKIFYLDKNKKFCNLLSKFKNLKILKIYQFDLIKDEISIYRLFKSISKFKKLEQLEIYIKFKLKINSLSILNNLIKFKSFNNLKIIKIPNIELDYYSNSFMNDFNNLFIDQFMNKLINIQTFYVNFKNRNHQLYLDNLNKNTLNNLYISSNDTNIFNGYYTILDKNSNKYIINNFVLLPNLKQLYLNLYLSEIKAILYIIESNTKNNLKKLIINFLNRETNIPNNIIYKNLFNKINSLNNLDTLILLNIPSSLQYLEYKNIENENEIKSNSSILLNNLQLPNKIKIICIDIILNYIKGIYIDILDLLFNNITQIKNLKFLILNLKRNKINFNTLKKLDISINNFVINNTSLEYLIITDINIFHYLYLFLVNFSKISTLKAIIILNSNPNLNIKISQQKKLYSFMNKQTNLLLYMPTITNSITIQTPTLTHIQIPITIPTINNYNIKLMNLLNEFNKNSLNDKFINYLSKCNNISIDNIVRNINTFSL
jgi:hypothetical protein